MTELRNSKGKLQGKWIPNDRTVIIRNKDGKADTYYRLKDDGSYEIEEKLIIKK